MKKNQLTPPIHASPRSSFLISAFIGLCIAMTTLCILLYILLYTIIISRTLPPSRMPESTTINRQ